MSPDAPSRGNPVRGFFWFLLPGLDARRARMPTKLYVGNRADSVTNEDLEALFSQAGKVDTATVVMDKFSGQSRGFGFVEMADSNEAARAIEEFNETELKGRAIRVNEARPGEGGGPGGPRG